jgi:hypothetical protein
MTSTAYGQRRESKGVIQTKLWDSDAAIDCPSPPTDSILAERQGFDDDLAKFLWQVFPQAFPLEPSPTHLRMIEEIQKAVTHGGLKAIAAPRGSGKTSILLRAALWAILTGRRKYV